MKNVPQDSSALVPWKTIATRPALQVGSGKFLRVELHQVELPDGQVIDDWPWVITPDFVNIVAETTDGLFICFRQTKYAVSGTSLSVTGGYLEPGEDALEGGKRELLEESGYAASDWYYLGKYPVDGNRGAGNAHLYLARNAQWTQAIDADDLEEQQMLMLSRDELRQSLLAGEFKVLSWSTAVAMALIWLTENEIG